MREAVNGSQELRFHRRTIVVVVGSLLLAFWSSVGVTSLGMGFPLLQEFLGVALLTLAPGFLILLFFDHSIDRLGEVILYVVGFSLVFLAGVSVVISLLYPLFGITNPLSFFPITLTISGILLGLTVWAYGRDRSFSLQDPSFTRRDTEIASFLLCLPVVAMLAAHRMNTVGGNRLMYAFLILIAVVVLVSIKAVPSKLYPFTVFTVAAAIILHRNLITNAVVGSDIQANYYFVELILENEVWLPVMTNTFSSLPIIGTVPAIYSVVTGISIAFVFKVLYSLIFALVPVGLYYVFKDTFGINIALVGAYFFIFYYRTFNGTPGKTRIAQLFVVLLLLVIITDQDRLPGKELVGGLVFGIGLIFSHYTTAYIFFISLIVAYVLGRIYEIYVGENLRWNTLGSIAIALGGLSVAWYAITTPTMIENVVNVLANIPAELYTFLSGGSAHRSGARSIQNQSTIVTEVTLLVHMFLMALAGIGILFQVFTSLLPADQRPSRKSVKLTTLALPFMMFLGASFFVSGNLGADRMYQITLVVLAAFMPVGYLVLKAVATTVTGVDIPVWQPLLAILAILLLLNAGVVHNAVGEPITSDISLDEDTHSLAYTDAEINGGEWIDNKGTAGPDIYTDSYTSQMFRGIIQETNTDANVIQIKVDWQPGIEFSQGYIYVRERAVVDAQEYDGEVPHYYLTESERAFIEQSTHKVYTNGEADVFRYDSTDRQQFGREDA